jgi:hypothetical protein
LGSVQRRLMQATKHTKPGSVGDLNRHISR